MSISNSPALIRTPAARRGRLPDVHNFTQAEINRKVDQLLTTDRSNERSYTLELLYHFVVLSERTLFDYVSKQIAISENITTFSRRLRNYRSDGLLVSVSQETIKSVLRAGLPAPAATQLRAYSLGPVGEEYARRKGWNGNAPIASLNDDVLAHDLICAETMLRMSELWLTHTNPGLVEVRGPREVLVWESDQKKAIVAPDGMLIKRSMEGNFERAFLVEYQNVRALLQVQNKLKKYEELAKPEYRWVWDAWGLDEMPWVLVIHRQDSTLQHYQDEIAQRGDMMARYAEISLADVWAGKLTVKPIRPVRKPAA